MAHQYLVICQNVTTSTLWRTHFCKNVFSGGPSSCPSAFSTTGLFICTRGAGLIGTTSARSLSVPCFCVGWESVALKPMWCTVLSLPRCNRIVCCFPGPKLAADVATPDHCFVAGSLYPMRTISSVDSNDGLLEVLMLACVLLYAMLANDWGLEPVSGQAWTSTCCNCTASATGMKQAVARVRMERVSMVMRAEKQNAVAGTGICFCDLLEREAHDAQQALPPSLN